MTLIKDRKIIIYAKKSQNLFILDFITFRKAMKISYKIDTPKQIYQIIALKE